MEFSGDRETARLSAAVSVLKRAQDQGETTAWVQLENGSLYPPDLAEAGVDLDALVVLRVPRESPERVGGATGLFQAADMLLMSRAFGLVILDSRETRLRLSPAAQGKLLSAVREGNSRLLFLTSKPTHSESVGALVGLRLEPRRVRIVPGVYSIEHHVLKNKPGLPFAEASERRRGPWGLR